MKSITKLSSLISILLVVNFSYCIGQNVAFRPYGKVGVLIKAPTTDDLDFGGSGWDDYQSLDKTTYGFGLQALKNVNSDIYVGADIGVQKLFKSTVRLPSYHFPSSYSEYIDKEWGIYIYPTLEYNKEDSPLFVQGGFGLNVITYDYLYESASGADEDSSSGTETNFGFNCTLGTKVNMSEGFSLPVAIRTDVLLRYSTMVQVSLIIGLQN